MLFTLDTVFLHERKREPQAGEGSGRLARAFGRAGRGAGARQGSLVVSRLAEREVKNTAGGSVGRARGGVPIYLSTRRRPTFFGGLNSIRHRKVVQDPHSVYYYSGPSLERGLGGLAVPNNRYYF